MLELSATSINDFLSCRKMYEYRKIRGIYPAEKPRALGFGSAVHKGLEHFFKQIQLGIEPSKEDAMSAVEVACEGNEMCPEDAIKATCLVDKYIDRYSENDCKWFEVLSVEYAFEAFLDNPETGKESKSFKLHGFIDGLVRDKNDGRLYILEHKTSGMVNDGYLDRILIDWQIAIYAHCISKIMKEPVVGAIYDIIKKPAIRMSAGTAKKPPETADEFRARCMDNITDDNFIRHTIIFEDSIMAGFLADIWSVANDMKGCKNYYKCTCNCLKYGTCPYMALCRANGDIEQVKEQYIVGNGEADTDGDAE